MSSSQAASAKREKILMLFTGVLLLAISIPMLNYLFGSSVTVKLNQKKVLGEKVQELNDRIQRAETSVKQLETDIQSALPNDNDKAAFLYKNWLLDLTGNAGFEKRDIQQKAVRAVKTGRQSEDQYRSHQFSIRAQGTFTQLGDFFRRFYSVNQLHLIRSVSMKPVDDAKKLDLVIEIEALNIPGTKNTELVTASNPLMAEVPWPEMTQTVARRNFFAAYVPPPRREERPVPPAAPRRVNPTPYTYINAITWINGKPQVWVTLRTEGQKYKLHEGEEFDIGSTRCVIHKIHDRSVEVKTGGTLWGIELGKSFAEAEEIPGEEKGEVSESEPIEGKPLDEETVSDDESMPREPESEVSEDGP
ncbi:MAG: hypothetical protein LBQ54_13980 [Planctomycetaceae bacterium]|jgi:outer membrane murein-binding lipoprotein Lpp|nr:hypothetical protein [Planctomycetaceae bacterium]